MRKPALFLLLLVSGCMPPPAPSNDGGTMGKVAPDFTVTKLGSMEKAKLSDHKGKVVLLDFWATWCGPCRMSSPEVQEMHEKYGGKGFEVMAITDEPARVVEPFKREAGTTYPVYLDPKYSAARAYQVQSLPTFILIGKDGKILSDMRGFGPGMIKAAVEHAMR